MSDKGIIVDFNSVARNALCPCGSEMRFKNCHGSLGSRSSELMREVALNQEMDLLYCKVETEVYALNDQSLLLVDSKTGRRILMAEIAVRALGEMAVFRTLDEHIRHSSLGEVLEKPDFHSLYSEFIQQGLLQTNEDLISSIQQSKKTEPQQTSKLAGVVIRTCERPELLKCLLSSLENRLASDNETFFILDDSRTDEAKKLNQHIVMEANKRLSNSIKYLGVSWQEEFIKKLITKFPDKKETIQWLLSPRAAGEFSAGRLNNIALLMHAGERIIIYDDDHRLDRAKQRLDSAQTDLKCCDQPEWSVIGHPSEEALLLDGKECVVDPTVTHALYLGEKLSTMMSSEEFTLKGDSFDELGRDAANNLTVESCILTTGSGIFGRPIEPNARWIYTHKYRHAAPPWKDPRNYKAVVEGKHFWKSVYRPSILSRTNKTPAGIDNRVMMPPTISIGKGEDTLFGSLLKTIYPDAIHLEFPWAIGHFREIRDWETATFLEPERINLAILLITHAFKIEQMSGSSSHADKYALIGSSLIEWSSKPSQQIKVDIRRCLTEMVTTRIRLCQKQLKSLDSEDTNCRVDIERIIEVNQKHLTLTAELPELDDSTWPGEEVQQLVWIREQFRSFGEALILWPALWRHCQNVKREAQSAPNAKE